MSNQAPKMDAGSIVALLFSLVAILLTVYVLVSSLINTYINNSTKGEVDSTAKVSSAIEDIKAIGVSSTSGAPASSAPAAARSGQEVYDAVCKACHAVGVANAPKLGDKAAWEPRVAAGMDSMMNIAINGKGAMPPRAGQNISDDELKTAIIYMAKEAGFDMGGAAPAPAAAPATQEPVASEPAQEPAAAEAAVEAPQAPAAPVQEPAPAAPEKEAAPAAPVAEEKAAPAADTTAEGKEVYDATCFTCHNTGVAASPILGNKEQWAPRIATGMEALYTTAINGKGAMPPKGGNLSLDNDKVKAAVDYIISQSK